MKFREKSTSKFYAFVLASVFAVALAGCGGGGGSTTEAPPPPMPTPEEMCTDAGNHWVDGACLTPSENTVRMALAAIAAAATAADAQAAYDAVKGDVSAAQGDVLQAAVDARATELATMARIDAQKMALSDAAGAIDTSALTSRDAVTAANMAIAALEAAIAAAVDVDDTSMYQTMVDNAKAAVATAVDALDLGDARDMQMAALTTASEALTTALAGLTGTPTQAQIDAVQMAVDGLNAAIQAGMDLSDAEKASAETAVATAEAQIDLAKKTLAANNAREEEEREAREQAEREAAEEEARKAAEAMAATAAKLYAGISAPMGDPASPVATDRAAAYNTDDSAILVTIGDGTNAPTAITLSEDKDTMVADNHGWAGKRYADAAGGDSVEAYVYSNVGDPMEGDKFGSPADDDDYQYTLDAGNNTELTMDDTNADAGWEARVASPSFDQSAGIKEFKLGTNLQRVMIAGSYHGVSGTYYCTPAASSTCAVQVAADGFNLGGTTDADNAFTAGGGTWTFKPGNREARVMGTPDNSYASYGWWLRKSEDGKTFTASAFVDERGADSAAATGITALRGTATYMGGAAGKYALSSSTGGTNDAGHFTARATLEADFNDDTITGTIDNFIGADGQSRDWSVTLNESTVSDTGDIAGDPDTTDNTDAQMTEWTIGGTAAADAGTWTGSLRETGDDGVPAIGTGTFYSTYGQDGKMVGAFGVNKQ